MLLRTCALVLQKEPSRTILTQFLAACIPGRGGKGRGLTKLYKFPIRRNQWTDRQPRRQTTGTTLRKRLTWENSRSEALAGIKFPREQTQTRRRMASRPSPRTGRLHVAADRVEAISDHAAGHAMTANGHGRKNAPGVGRRIVRFKRMIGGVLEEVLILSACDINPAFVDARHPNRCARLAFWPVGGPRYRWRDRRLRRSRDRKTLR